MSRSGYSDDCEYIGLYRGAVDRAMEGKRGQAFLRELAQEMDAMSEKRLITGELIDGSGEVCAIGVVCKARGIDVSNVDVYNPTRVGRLVGVAQAMAAEIEFENDECGQHETPEQRWTRMRAWVTLNINSKPSIGGGK